MCAIRHLITAGLAVCFTIGVGVITMARQKDARATVQVVTIEPGQKDSAHRHVGPVFGYILEGEYEHALNDEPIETFNAGETFDEPSGFVHRVAHKTRAARPTPASWR